jgi:hypothetical protein
MEFCKLKNTFDVGEYNIQKEQMFFGEKNKGIGYYNVDLPKKDELMFLIPKKYHKDFSITMMRVNTEIPPHTDSGIKSTINFYIQTGNCLTQFYKLAIDKPKTKQVKNQSDGLIYNENDLIRTTSFIAEPGEAWLLDVTIPHSVKPYGNFKERLAIAMSSTLCYNDVKQILTMTGQL